MEDKLLFVALIVLLLVLAFRLYQDKGLVIIHKMPVLSKALGVEEYYDPVKGYRDEMEPNLLSKNLESYVPEKGTRWGFQPGRFPKPDLFV